MKIRQLQVPVRNYFLSQSIELQNSLNTHDIRRPHFFVIALAVMLSTLKGNFAFSKDMKNLKPGQCIADPLSKNYLKSIRAAKQDVYKGMISEIGIERFQSLQDTPDNNYYFCEVTCANSVGTLEKIWITQSDNPSNFTNMNGFLCHSVSIERVVIVGSITGPEPVAKTFNAFETSFVELHNWLKKSHFILSQEATTQHWQTLKVNLNDVARAYLSAKLPVFIEAGAQLWEMAYQTETGKRLLADKLSQYVRRDWQMPVDYQDPNYLVFNALKSVGRFLEYQYVPPSVTLPGRGSE